MGIIAEQIKEKLQAAFNPAHLVITDDSSKHAGHAGSRPGGESHFTVEMVSGSLSGLSRVDAQRRVYAALGDLMHSQIHALALKLSAPLP